MAGFPAEPPMLPDDPDAQARLLYLALLGLAIASALFRLYRARLGTALQHAAIWLLIVVGLVLAYGFKDQLASQLLPGRAAPAGEQAIALRRAADGHFYARVEVNGVPIRFLVDTGASSVVLTREDAALAGLEPETLAYTVPAGTANGMVMGAPVTLGHLELGGIADAGVRGLVNGGELRTSLLGMSYLGRFRRFSIEGDLMLLAR